MSQWKKLVYSGSNPQFANVTVDNIVSASIFSGSHVGNGSGLTGVVASASPGGSDKTIQFNDAGATSGSSNFTFDKTTNTAYLTGSLMATSVTASLQGSASYAISSSWSSGSYSTVSASFARSASYFQEIKTFGISIDGGGSEITTGVKGDITIPFNCTINSWFITADQAGSIVIDVWKDTLANFPPTVADTIAGSEKPTLSGVAFNSDVALTSFTGSITANDVIRFNVDSIATVTRVNLVFKATI